MRSKRKSKPALVAPPSDFMEAPLDLSEVEHSLVSAPDLSRSPVRVGPYLLLERLGAGGMAEVYLARKEGVKGFEKEVALKCVLPRHFTDQNVNHWFEREAKLGSRLNHANIAQIYDFTRIQDSYWLVLEYVHGQTLEAILKKARESRIKIPTPVASYIICEVLKGLAYAHSSHGARAGDASAIIHRDITPKNIMLSYQGEVKIVDFGIAKSGLEGNSRSTQIGLVKGTPGYMSPEQSRALPFDLRTDLYSTCAVLYELIAAKRLFSNLSASETETKHDRAVASKLKGLAAPASIKKFLAKGLAWGSSKRFSSAAEMRTLLEKEFHGTEDFSQGAAVGLLNLLFESQIAQEKRDSEKREARIDLWRSRGLWLPAVESSSRPDDSARWKRSPLILVLLLVTVTTTFLNLYVQLAPIGLPFGHSLYWISRTPLSLRSCSIGVKSVPAGADISVNSIFVGKTPASFQVKCGTQLRILLEREGYEPLKTELPAAEPSHQILLYLSKMR